MRFGLVSAVAWVLGIVAYALVLRVRHGERLGGGDARAVVVFSAIAFAITVVLVYMPLFRFLRRRIRVVRPLLVFPALAFLLTVFPTTLISWIFGGGIRGAWSPEGQLFLALFAVSGAAFGVGYGAILSTEPSSR